MPHAAICEVKLIGTDAGDQPFWQTAPVASAASHYLEMARIPGLCQPGQVVTVEFENRQRRYLIADVRSDGSARLEAVADVVGIFPEDLLNGDQSRPGFWNDIASRPSSEPIHVEPVRVAKVSGTRRYSRRRLRTAVVVRERSSGRDVCGEMIEMSAGGCYIEMWSPLAVGTDVEVRCDAPGLGFRAAGRVVYSDPLVGMGIAFSAPCFVADPGPEVANANGAGRGPDFSTSPAASGRLAAALQSWFGEHNYLEKIDFVRMLEACRRD